MQADVILGVTIAVFAPLYGAALVVLCCLRMYAALPARNYDLIIDVYSRVLRWNSLRAATYAQTRNSQHATTHCYSTLCQSYIGTCRFGVQDDNEGLRSLRRKGALALSVPSVFLQALHRGRELLQRAPHPTGKRKC
jgi:hypothetical protein